MSIQKSQLGRFRKLNEYFRNTLHPLTLDELTEKLIEDLGLDSLSTRTVQADRKYIEDHYGAEFKKIKKGNKTTWLYNDANFSIDNLPIDEGEVMLLKEAVEIISALKAFPITKDLQEVVSKLEQRGNLLIAPVNKIIQFETNELTRGREHLVNIYVAVKEQTVLQITYQKFISDTKCEFLIHPYLLEEYRNRWYVLCLIDGKNDITTFALDRIIKIKNSSKLYQHNKYFEPEKYFDNVIGINRKKEDKPVKIKIKVAEKQAAYFNTQPLHHTQKAGKPNNDGSVLMEYNLIINLELKQLLLSYAGSIKVIEPAELKEEIGEMIREIIGVWR